MRYRPDPSRWLPRVLTREAAAARWNLSADAADRRLQRGVWLCLAPGVYCTAPPATDTDLLVAATLHGGPSACVSGSAALAHRDFRSVTTWDHALTLVPMGSGPRSVGRIRIRPTDHLPSGELQREVRLAPVARCVVDHAIGTHHPLDHVRAVVAEAVQRHGCRPDDLAAVLATAGMRGSKRLRLAIADIGAGARSAPEARVAAAFRLLPLPPWRLNHPVRAGARRFVLDVWFEALRAAVEIDGEQFHRFGEDWDRTLSRDAALQTAGIAVLHVQPSMIRSVDGLAELVIPWLRRRADDLGVPWQWG